MTKPTIISKNSRNLSNLSKSERIIETVIESIKNSNILVGDALTSVNVAARDFGVARQTIVRAYEKLKKLGFVESRPRK